MEDFTILRGNQAIENPRFQFLKRYSAPFLPTLVATAVPGGPVASETYAKIKAEFLERLTALLPLDGLYLPMHGAMFVEGMQDAEGDWFESARKVVGPKCLMSASYDLHGNISKHIIDMIDMIDMMSAFRTAPHIDRQETMSRACDMLVKCRNTSGAKHRTCSATDIGPASCLLRSYRFIGLHPGDRLPCRRFSWF